MSPLESDPRFALLLARARLVEGYYKTLEEADPTLQPLREEQIATMNERLGFKAGDDNYKGQDYRPYCIREKCDYMPRMYRIADGFRCWSCGNRWILKPSQ